LSAKDFGQFSGFEARDEASGTLLARAKQVKIEGQILVVEETQYSADGAAVYQGKLFFDESDRLAREQRVEGQKKWDIFHTSMKESVGCHEHASPLRSTHIGSG